MSLPSFRRINILYKCPYNSQILVGMNIVYDLHETLNLATFMVFTKLKFVTGDRVESVGKQADRSDVWLTVYRNSVWIRKTN